MMKILKPFYLVLLLPHLINLKILRRGKYFNELVRKLILKIYMIDKRNVYENYYSW